MTHSASMGEATLPPLVPGPYRKRIGLISIVACLGGLLFGYDTGVANGAEGPMQAELGLTDLQVGIVISSLVFAAAVGALIGGKISDAHRTPHHDHRARGHVLRGRAGRRLLAQFRDPGGRPDHSRARGRRRFDGGAGVPGGAGAVRDPRVDHGPQRAGDRRGPVRGLRGQLHPPRHARACRRVCGASCSGCARSRRSPCSSACCGCPSRRAGSSRRAAMRRPSPC